MKRVFYCSVCVFPHVAVSVVGCGAGSGVSGVVGMVFPVVVFVRSDPVLTVLPELFFICSSICFIISSRCFVAASSAAFFV